MAIQFPASPTTNQQFIAGGKLFVWNSPSWRRGYLYAIMDGGFSETEVSGESATVDGGDA